MAPTLDVLVLFCFILRFFNKYPPIFSILSEFWRWIIENIAVYPDYRKYCGISEYIENKLSHLSHAISELWTLYELLKRFPSTKGTLWMFRNSFLSSSFKNVLSMFLQVFEPYV